MKITRMSLQRCSNIDILVMDLYLIASTFKDTEVLNTSNCLQQLKELILAY